MHKGRCASLRIPRRRLEARAVLLLAPRVPGERWWEAGSGSRDTGRDTRRTIRIWCSANLADGHVSGSGVPGGGCPAGRASAEWSLAAAGTAKSTRERHGLLPDFERVA